jgi:predicted TIM-barrel fold metal-dependent hydrolase
VPYPEDDIPSIVRGLGDDASCLVMGSDYPHAEGLAEPAEFRDLLDPLPESAQRAILRDNAEALFTR